MWRTSAVFVIPFAMYCSFYFQKYIFFGSNSPYPINVRREAAPNFKCEIINVHAGLENRTAIHLHPFQTLCQPQFSGFVRI
jgi:hypothetical protein